MVKTAPIYGPVALEAKAYFLPVEEGITLRVACWPVESSNKMVLLLNGRSESLEKYHETINRLTRRGYTVYSFDWRGQGLSSRISSDRRIGHIDTFQTYLNDLDKVVSFFGIDRFQGDRILIAHSMGGLLAGLFINKNINLFKAAIFSAPMFKINLSLN